MDEQKTQLQQIFKNNHVKQNRILILVILLLILFLISIFQNVQGRQNLHYLWILILFIVISIYSSNIASQNELIQKKLQAISIFQQRKNYEFDHLEQGINYDHLIELEDLHIVGDHSLFQYMNIAQTKQGKQSFLDRFNLVHNDLLDYQKAIEILSKQEEVLLSIATYDEIQDLEVIKNTFQNSKKPSKLILMFDILLDGLCFLSLIYLPIEASLMILMVHYCIASLYQKYITISVEQLTSVISSLKKMQVILEEKDSYLLKQINFHLKQNNTLMKQLEKFNTCIHLDHQFLSSFLFNGLFSFKLWMIYYFDSHLSYVSIDEYLKSYVDLEVLANFAYLTHLTPITLVEESDHLEIEEGRIPFIKNCISNSFTPYHQVAIITGSNMSGKTSFLRMVGMNCMYAKACGYAFCKRMKSPFFQVYTSINVLDDPKNGRSTFYGELLRMKNALDGKSKKIVLIDEIFKGTNYQDRMIGSKKIIQQFLKQDAIVLITTHDYELNQLLDIDSYYFKEEYIEGTIHFNYQIHEGKSQVSNAIYLMKQLEIIEE